MDEVVEVPEVVVVVAEVSDLELVSEGSRTLDAKENVSDSVWVDKVHSLQHTREQISVLSACTLKMSLLLSYVVTYLTHKD